MHLVENTAVELPVTDTPIAREIGMLETTPGLCAFVLALPWGGDTTTVGSFILASLIFVVPVGLLALRLLMVRKVRRLSTIHYLLLAFTAWVAASLLWTIDSEATTTRLGTYVQLLVFVGLIWELAPTKSRVQGLIICYVLGSLYASLETIYNYAMGRTMSQLEGADWETNRYSVDGINADELGLIIALSIPMALYLLTANRNLLLKALCWGQLVAGFTAILLTATRGAMFAVLVGVMVISVPTLSRMSRTQKGMAVIACVALLACAALFVPRASIDRYLTTGTELTQGTLTHRTVIWAAGLEVFRDHPIVGVGAGAYGQAVVKLIDIAYIAHNTFISVLVELGMVGAALFLLLLGSMLHSVFRMPYLEKWLWLAVLATWATGAASVTWENRKISWLLFGLVAAQAYAKTTGVFRLRREPAQPAYVTPRWERHPAPPPLAVTMGSMTHRF